MGNGKGGSELLEFLDRTAGELCGLKEALAEDFMKIGNFVVCTSGEIGQLANHARPYLEYYYPEPGAPAGPSFVEEILVPGREQMTATFDTVIRLMEDNEEISARALGELETMISMYVDIRSLISGVRAMHPSGGNRENPGAEGGGGDLGSLIEGLLDECTLFLNGFRRDYDEYSGIRKWMHTVHSRYLKKMKGRFAEAFDESIALFRKPPGETMRLQERLAGLADYAALITERLQVEDLMRQDLEKVIFFGESLGERMPALDGGNGAQGASRAALHMVHEKIATVRDTLDSFSAEFPSVCRNMYELLGECAPEGGLSRETLDLTGAWKRFNRIEGLLASHTRKIIQMRQTLFGLHYRLLRSKGTFQEFIERILEMRGGLYGETGTSPETADGRNAGLAALRAGAHRHLAMVTSLNAGLETITGSYNDNYAGQEQMLQRILFHANRVSVQLGDAVKQRKSMTGEIARKATRIAQAIVDADLPFRRLEGVRDGLRTHLDVMENLFPETAAGSQGHGEEFDAGLSLIRERYERGGDSADYRHMMTLSLFRDFRAGRNDGVVFF